VFHILVIRALNLFRISSLVFRISAVPAAAFMQNEPNFHRGKNEPNPIYKKGLRTFYTPSDNQKRTQNEPKTNPIQTQSSKGQNQCNPIRHKGLRQQTTPSGSGKTNPKRTQNEPNFHSPKLPPLPIPPGIRNLALSEVEGTIYDIRHTTYEIRNTRYAIRDTRYEPNSPPCQTAGIYSLPRQQPLI